MKLKELLANTLQTVIAQKQALHPPRSLYEEKDYYKYVLDMERDESWLRLSELFKKSELEATPETLKPFVRFLEMRWRRIARIFELTYFRNNKDPLTRVCESLADELKLGHRLELLMPAVNFDNDNIVDNNEKGTTIAELDHLDEAHHIKQSFMRAGADIGKIIQEEEINEAVNSQLTPDEINQARDEGLKAAKAEKFQLHHFVLDNEDRIIHVLDCLSYAQLDGRLKHTNKRFKYQDSVLSAKEGSKVIYHSQEAKLLFLSVGDFWQKRKTSFSIGGHINRLIDALKANGEKVGMILPTGATGEMPAWKLNESVQEFYSFTKLLTTEELEYLYSRNSTNFEYRSFKYYWFRLLQGFSYLLSDAELLEINEYMDYCKFIEMAELEAIAMPMPVEVPVAQLVPMAQIVEEDDTEYDSEDSDDTLSETRGSSADENEESEAEHEPEPAPEPAPAPVTVQPVIAIVEFDAANTETPCVEVISSYFEEVLFGNFELYYKVPECYAEMERRKLVRCENSV